MSSSFGSTPGSSARTTTPSSLSETSMAVETAPKLGASSSAKPQGSAKKRSNIRSISLRRRSTGWVLAGTLAGELERDFQGRMFICVLLAAVLFLGRVLGAAVLGVAVLDVGVDVPGLADRGRRRRIPRP